MTTTTPVVPFSFESHEVRTITLDGNPWFVAKDVCDVLGYQNPSKTLGDHLDDDERSNVSLGRQGKTNIISESGLYTLILRSNKPAAKPFRKWVTAEVLPAIRKTGFYRQPGADPDKPETLLIVAREFRAAVRMARAAGLRDAGAVLAADRLTAELTGFSPVALLDEDVTDLLEEAL